MQLSAYRRFGLFFLLKVTKVIYIANNWNLLHDHRCCLFILFLAYSMHVNLHLPSSLIAVIYLVWSQQDIAHTVNALVCGRGDSHKRITVKSKNSYSSRNINRKYDTWLMCFFSSYPDWWQRFPQMRSGEGPGRHQTQAAGCRQRWTGRTGCSPS